MAQGGRRPKEAHERKDTWIAARVPAATLAQIDLIVSLEGTRRSKWLRKTIEQVARHRTYNRLSPIDIADLSRAIVLIRASHPDHPALPLIRGILARHP